MPKKAKKQTQKQVSVHTHIAVVLDRSGSMQSVRTDTIGGFNAFLKEQQAVPGSASITLAQFDNVYEVVYAGKPIKDAPELTAQTFVPRGSTALLDAIGRTINETEAVKADKVVFVILTDGMENASREFTHAKVMEMVKAHDKWQFVYLGANQDAIKTGGGLGISAQSSMTYAANAVGTQHAFASTSRSLSDYRTGASASVAYDASDRDLQKKAGAA